MVFAKALCVVLLLYSASFGESRSLKSDSNSEKTQKRMVSGNAEAKGIAQQLVKAVRDASGKGGQLAYIYLQPKNENNLVLSDKTVMDALFKNKNLPSNTKLWPSSPDNTNFRLAFVDYSKPKESNYGHSEYQLLIGNGLGKMITPFQKRYGDCPEYVIFYSSNLPCSRPNNPNPSHPRCAEMTLQARKDLTGMCGTGTTFYLYTDKETPTALADQRKMDFLQNSGIIWIHP